MFVETSPVDWPQGVFSCREPQALAVGINRASYREPRALAVGCAANGKMGIFLGELLGWHCVFSRGATAGGSLGRKSQVRVSNKSDLGLASQANACRCCATEISPHLVLVHKMGQSNPSTYVFGIASMKLESKWPGAATLPTLQGKCPLL